MFEKGANKMKGNKGAKTSRFPGNESTFEQVFTVIILDTFILALFSIVMLATAVVSVTTKNGLQDASRTEVERRQNPEGPIARVEKHFSTAATRREEISKLVGLIRPGSPGGSVHQGLLPDSGTFTFHRPAPMRFFERPTNAQVGMSEKSTGGFQGGKTDSPSPIMPDRVAALPPERETKGSTAAGGFEPWNTSEDFYDGYGISTTINYR